MDADLFPAGLLITRAMRDIVSANAYFDKQFGWQASGLIGQSLKTLLSKASVIFVESYVIPMLLSNGHCDEVRITIINAAGERMPTVASIRSDGDLQYWVITPATDREQLYNEYKKGQRTLEERANVLAELAITDSLTGLFNRRELDKRLAAAVNDAENTSGNLSLMLLDVDHFKQVNDEFGHAVGDTVLVTLGKLLQDSRRPNDIVGRFGGEEFLLALPGADADSGAKFAERLLEQIRTLDVQGVQVTASIGHSQYRPQVDETYEALIKRADVALYSAKAAGRNRVVSAD